jgi:hypothetical protein
MDRPYVPRGEYALTMAEISTAGGMGVCFTGQCSSGYRLVLDFEVN